MSIIFLQKITDFRSFFPDIWNMDFWDRVDQGIERENTSYAYIAKKLGKRESTVSGWHRGEKKIIPPANCAVEIAKILKTTVEELVTGKPPAGLSPESLEIARSAERLNEAGKQAALATVRGLESVFPLDSSVLSNSGGA
jgi:transcriptional regulator with XRE-family HTH domain